MNESVRASRALQPRFYHAPYPDELYERKGIKPMEFQFAGAEYALSKDHCLIGDPPGLTKTAQSIMVDNAIESRRTLVICPASLRLNWEREIWSWSTIENVHTYPVIKSKDGISPKAHFNIISYAMAANPGIQDAIMDKMWDHVILDEAHALKDPKGNTRTRMICAPDMLPSVTGRFTALSGTIMPNQPIECYNLIRLFDWEAINCTSLAGFREHYYEESGGLIRGPYYDEKSDTFKSGLHWDESVRNKPRNLAQLQQALRSHIMVRRSKKQVMPYLPAVRLHMVPMEMTADIRRAMKHPGWREAEALHQMDPNNFATGIPIDGEISTARRELGEAKAPQVAKYIENMLEEGTEKIVVGAWHRSVLKILRERLSKHGLVYMDGSTSTMKKQQAVDEFQAREEISIILGQTATVGEGWTLTAAQDVINAEPDWVPGRNGQLIDRINRMGQIGSYQTGHFCVAPDTLDERIVGTAVRKDIAIFKGLDKE